MCKNANQFGRRMDCKKNKKWKKISNLECTDESMWKSFNFDLISALFIWIFHKWITIFDSIFSLLHNIKISHFSLSFVIVSPFLSFSLFSLLVDGVLPLCTKHTHKHTTCYACLFNVARCIYSLPIICADLHSKSENLTRVYYKLLYEMYSVFVVPQYAYENIFQCAYTHIYI